MDFQLVTALFQAKNNDFFSNLQIALGDIFWLGNLHLNVSTSFVTLFCIGKKWLQLASDINNRKSKMNLKIK